MNNNLNGNLTPHLMPTLEQLTKSVPETIIIFKHQSCGPTEMISKNAIKYHTIIGDDIILQETKYE